MRTCNLPDADGQSFVVTEFFRRVLSYIICSHVTCDCVVSDFTHIPQQVETCMCWLMRMAIASMCACACVKGVM